MAGPARAPRRDMAGGRTAAGTTGLGQRPMDERALGVSASTAIRWVERARQGEREPRKPGRRPASALDAHEAFIVDLIDAQKDITLNEMVARLHDERDILVSRSGLNVWLHKHGFTYKKSPHTHWSRTAPTS